jgi:ribosome-associated heat shock protein Hsp15
VESPDRVRIDKWLWAVRLYKRRSLATDACNAGHVKIGGQNVKPSRSLHVGETITALAGRLHRTVKVLALLEHRIGAKLVPDYLEDLTPPAEYERAREQRAEPLIQYPPGWGRPTKKARRQLERLR